MDNKKNTDPVRTDDFLLKTCQRVSFNVPKYNLVSFIAIRVIYLLATFLSQNDFTNKF